MAGGLSLGLGLGLTRSLGGGGTRPSALMIAKAQKIIAAANAWSERSVTGSPPTITRSAAYAASTIGGGDAGAPTLIPTTTGFRWSGPLVSQFGAYYGGYKTADILLDGGDGWGCGFKTNSRYVEISLGYGRADQTFQGRVNGQWFSSSDLALFGSSPDSSYRFIRLDFGTTATRTIELFFRSVQDTRGFNLAAGATLALPDTTAADVRSAIWGDSYVEANGGLYNVRYNPAQRGHEKMGVTDPTTMGRSNQGIVLARDGRTIAGRMVLDAPKVAAIDFDFIDTYLSFNDNAQLAATIQTNTQTGIAALMAQFPNTWIFAYSSWKVDNGNTINAARNAAFIAGARAAKGSSPYVLIIDTQALGAPSVATVAGGSIDLIHGGAADIETHTDWWKANRLSTLAGAIA